MESKLFTRKVWDPEKGEYLIEIENAEKTLVETPCGQRRAVLIRVCDEPYVWLIDHRRKEGKEASEGLDRVLMEKPKVKVTVEGEKERTYKVDRECGSLKISFAVCVNGRYHILNSEIIPIGGEK